jgi:siroheme synthase-like protein
VRETAAQRNERIKAAKAPWDILPDIERYARAGYDAIAATDDGAVNGRVAEDARRRRILCNVVDAPEHCDFIAPAVVRRGPLVAALSTGGGSPALASRLARDLTAAWGPEYGQLVLAMRSLRPLVRRLLPDARRRKTYWLAVAARDDLLALGRRGGRNAVRAALLEALARHADPA